MQALVAEPPDILGDTTHGGRPPEYLPFPAMLHTSWWLVRNPLFLGGRKPLNPLRAGGSHNPGLKVVRKDLLSDRQ